MDPYYAAGLRHMKEQKLKQEMGKAGEMIMGTQEAILDKELQALENLDEVGEGWGGVARRALPRAPSHSLVNEGRLGVGASAETEGQAGRPPVGG